MPFPDEVRPVAVVDYRPGWPTEFVALAGVLADALGRRASAVDHVGSTSVPGLAAKDVLDVQVRVATLDDPLLVDRLAAIGFRCRPEPWNRAETTEGRAYRKLVFAPPPGARPANVHVRERDGRNTRFALLFRDYLRADPAARTSWGAFKKRLAASVPDLPAYGQIKAPATEVLMCAAERWARSVAWEVR